MCVSSVYTHTEGYELLLCFPLPLPKVPVDHQPLPPFLKTAGLQTVRVQSDSDCGPMHGALCIDYTKLLTHKTNRCIIAKFPSCGFSLRHDYRLA